MKACHGEAMRDKGVIPAAVCITRQSFGKTRSSGVPSSNVPRFASAIHLVVRIGINVFQGWDYPE